MSRPTTRRPGPWPCRTWSCPSTPCHRCSVLSRNRSAVCKLQPFLLLRSYLRSFSFWGGEGGSSTFTRFKIILHYYDHPKRAGKFKFRLFIRPLKISASIFSSFKIFLLLFVFCENRVTGCCLFWPVEMRMRNFKNPRYFRPLKFSSFYSSFVKTFMIWVSRNAHAQTLQCVHF